MPKFLRRTSNRYSKLGRKKKQTWRKPKGRDNKMREKRKNYPKTVSIGYKEKKKSRKKILIIRNPKDLENVKKNYLIVLGNVGKRKKIEIAKKAYKDKIQISNLNISKFLKKIKKQTKESPQKTKSNENKK